MGCSAVPHLVNALGDERKLPLPYIRLENRGTNSFEAFRQYGPETVTDALAALLNQLTGQDFGFIYNGGTASERDVAIQGGQRFLRETRPEVLCGAAGGG
jgi:hypothetical protein